MRGVYFLRGAPYNYVMGGMNLYESFDAVAKREADPPILGDTASYASQLECKIDTSHYTVLSSPAKRSIQTAELISNDPKKVYALREIGYSMGEIITEKEFFGRNGVPNVIKARIAFVEALVRDGLTESYSGVMGRIHAVLGEIKKTGSNDVVVVSHGFFLKVLESYIKDGSIAEIPERLLLNFNGDTAAYSFLCGFHAIMEENQFRFRGYLTGVKE